MKLFLTLAATLIATGTVCAAAQMEDTMKKDRMDMSMADKFDKMDADMDGTVTKAEYVAYAEKKAAAEFDSMAGSDSLLSLEEIDMHDMKTDKMHDGMMKDAMTESMMEDDMMEDDM